MVIKIFRGLFNALIIMKLKRKSEFLHTRLKRHVNSKFIFALSLSILFIFFQTRLTGNATPQFSADTCAMFEKNTIFVGSAKINITPSVPVVMAGYGSRTDPFTGVMDSLFATAIVFDDGVNKAVIITAEILGFSHEAWEELTSRIERETGILRKFIMLAPVHNHGGPSTRTNTDDIDENLIAYNIELKDKLIAVVSEAADNLQPALIGSGKGICKMSINRRANNAKGEIRFGMNPYGACDQEVGVVRIDDMSGIPFSIFVNWPTHATVMGGQNYMITGDWPGAARRYIESETSEPVVVSITAGASANIDPIYRVKPTFTPNDTEAIGAILGQEVLRVNDEINTFKSGSIKAIQKVITLPGKKPGSMKTPDGTFESGPYVEVRLSLLMVGNILFAGISGELFTEIGIKIKELSPYRYTYVITHCNGSSGYLITDSAYDEGGYEVYVTRVMPGAEQVIIENFTKMMFEIDL